ncbi:MULTISPECIES: cupredoxin family copper-binding protein [unclassified Rhodococcus (in: high G+C Gram-positive bacteria)]|uniref:cupredoxin domain-containing protein n=1 Tax=unclassified Rhodococcus (in: high G+C Gram-positive bacteria) TaxID=192944 RepID=UPI001639A803|nr:MULTISPECIES: cupredoxin family copper-binding protein [unclassified Rhodococcus (in: high G+C Gram-positive bacteria)]MBC2644210.1 cupredoxin family copper-binding protein [Rhodococcus sp. 3A]MBC2891051.1 cupredoxin family copper-binding protein [Rhodococcus sp. 4CII]
MRLFVGRRHAIAAAMAAALLTAAACGTSGSDATSNDTASPTFVFASGAETPGMSGGTAPAAAPNMTDMTDMTGMTAPAQAPAAPAAANAVDIDNFAFAPAALTVPVGSTVTWTNKDEEPHTVASGDGSFHSPGMGTDATYSFTFTKAGSFDYTCSIHPFMHATVVVTP